MVLHGTTVILANLVLGENVVPEFLQTKCTAANLATALLEILDDTPARRRQQRRIRPARCDPRHERDDAERTRRACRAGFAGAARQVGRPGGELITPVLADATPVCQGGVKLMIVFSYSQRASTI